MVDSKIMEITESILKDFGNTYFSDKGALKRNKVIEDLDAYTPMLMKALLANELIHDTYTESLTVGDNSVEIFKLNQFIEMFTYKEYWQDSYTKFENKIGLTAGNRFIDETADVVLDFPFKDTLLKAGMTKEDQKNANEPFLHETIAKAEIDTLLEPKIFVNATKYSEKYLDGEVVSNFDDENLIIKGNNLIALHSLKKRYAGKVKMIYIDPPYNTGKDGFNYNDKFNHTSWLTFMKNRLEIAKDLLSDSGSLWINIDDDEQAYLKVLSDNIFGRTNFVNNVIWQKKYAPQNDAKRFTDNHDHILVYAKNKDIWKPNLLPRTEKQAQYYKYDDGDGRGKWRTDNILVKSFTKDRVFEVINPNTNQIFLPPEGRCWRYSKESFEKMIKENRIYWGKDGTGAPQVKRYWNSVKQGITPLTIWLRDEVSDNQEAKKEISAFMFDNLFETPKPEKLLQRITHIASNKGDIILDFFMGSATTQAVAMKMNRHFIGVEQMEYVKTVSLERLKEVIAGEQGGISKSVNWQGGGSFVYAELMEKSQGYLKDVQCAETTKQLEDVVNSMMKNDVDFDFRVDIDRVLRDPEYQGMSLYNKKKLMVKVIDKNQLYYVYSDLEDNDVKKLMSESDVSFNRSFYGERDF